MKNLFKRKTPISKKQKTGKALARWVEKSVCIIIYESTKRPCSFSINCNFCELKDKKVLIFEPKGFKNER